MTQTVVDRWLTIQLMPLILHQTVDVFRCLRVSEYLSSRSENRVKVSLSRDLLCQNKEKTSLLVWVSVLNSVMDPLGVTEGFVDAISIPRWGSTPVPAYEKVTPPTNDRRTHSPFPVRQDINSKVTLW